MTSLSTLILIPAPNPGCVGREAGETWTGEAADIVGACCLYTAVWGPIEQSVVDVTFVNVNTLGELEAGVAHHPRHTVRVIAAANLAVVTDAVEAVAVSVATVVWGAEPKPGTVVWILREGSDNHKNILESTVQC